MPVGNSGLGHMVMASELVVKLLESTDTFPMTKENMEVHIIITI